MKKTDKQIANKIIAEMQEFGLTSDEMLNVIQLAREKFKKLKSKRND